MHRVTLSNAVMPSGAWGLFTRQQVRSKTRFSLETRGGGPGCGGQGGRACGRRSGSGLPFASHKSSGESLRVA